MHGRYTYQNDIFNFWNFSKNDNETKTFDLTISYDEFVDIIIAKESGEEIIMITSISFNEVLLCLI
jgi:hypothetical protein